MWNSKISRLEGAIMEFWGFEATYFMDIQLGKSNSQLILPKYISLHVNSALLFFSLDWPVTKNQILNTKWQPKVFVVVST